MNAFPGQVWNGAYYQYDPRWPFGQDCMLKVVSMTAAESIPPGVLVQATAAGTLQIARDLTRLVGVTTYDPRRFDHLVVYQQFDVVPVVRRGSVFVAFLTVQPPFADPQACAAARAYLGAGNGQFTTDAAGTQLTACHFSLASDPYYQNSNGSPQADVPYPIIPPPIDVTNTTFGSGVALVDLG